MSDIDTEAVDNLKVLDPNRPIREATEIATSRAVAKCREQVQQKWRVFDHLVGATEQRQRKREPKRFLSLKIEHQFDVDRLAQNPRPQTVAIAAEDAEFSRNAAEAARENVQKFGFKIVYDKAYPPNTTDFSPIIRAIQATSPELVVICSYPKTPLWGWCRARASWD